MIYLFRYFKNYLVLLMVCVFSVTSLASEAPVKDTIKLQRSRNPVTITEIPQFKYSKDDKALILYNGICYGTLKFNSSQNLGIWDWYNQDAVDAGIKHSYTTNWTVDMSLLLKEYEMSKITITVDIMENEQKPISDPCMVGWSGFPQSIELFNQGETKGDIEVGIQPISKTIHGKSFLRVNLEDSTNNIKFDPIYYDLSVLSSATEGSSLKVVDEESVITSINGAIYSILFTRVENNVRDTDNGSEDLPLYDVNYTVRYKQAPTNNRVVSIFDSFDGNKISPRIAYAVQSDNDSTLLYNEVGSALEETDKHHKFRYVSTKQSFDVGNSFKYKSNRRISDGVIPATDYVRIIVEFPEERAARTNDEMREFDGRYIVYQLKLSEYVMPTESEVFGG